METSGDLLSMTAAATLAGVTADTLQQYERYGLLSAERRPDGVVFKRAEICSLFHVLERVRKNSENQREAGKQETASAEPPVVESVTAKDEAVARPNQTVVAETNAANETETLHEVNQLLRAQVQVLREERDWLRERVERLEARSEREQMLLLAESQTVRTLVAQNEHSRKDGLGRRWRFALPWLRP